MSIFSGIFGKKITQTENSLDSSLLRMSRSFQILLKIAKQDCDIINGCFEVASTIHSFDKTQANANRVAKKKNLLGFVKLKMHGLEISVQRKTNLLYTDIKKSQEGIVTYSEVMNSKTFSKISTNDANIAREVYANKSREISNLLTKLKEIEKIIAVEASIIKLIEKQILSIPSTTNTDTTEVYNSITSLKQNLQSQRDGLVFCLELVEEIIKEASAIKKIEDEKKQRSNDALREYWSVCYHGSGHLFALKDLQMTREGLGLNIFAKRTGSTEGGYGFYVAKYLWQPYGQQRFRKYVESEGPESAEKYADWAFHETQKAFIYEIRLKSSTVIEKSIECKIGKSKFDELLAQGIDMIGQNVEAVIINKDKIESLKLIYVATKHLLEVRRATFNELRLNKLDGEVILFSEDDLLDYLQTIFPQGYRDFEFKRARIYASKDDNVETILEIRPSPNFVDFKKVN